MIAAYLRRKLRMFEARFDYDTSYMRELVDTDTGGTLKLAMATGFLNHRFALAPAPYYAAKLVAAQSADCGSCLKLAIRMATDAGLGIEAIASVLAGASHEAPHEMDLAARYAHAVIGNRPELPQIMAECEALWGKRGIAGLAAAVVSGIFYPQLKRGLGHGNSCEPVMAWLRQQARAKAQMRLETSTA